MAAVAASAANAHANANGAPMPSAATAPPALVPSAMPIPNAELVQPDDSVAVPGRARLLVGAYWQPIAGAQPRPATTLANAVTASEPPLATSGAVVATISVSRSR